VALPLRLEELPCWITVTRVAEQAVHSCSSIVAATNTVGLQGTYCPLLRSLSGDHHWLFENEPIMQVLMVAVRSRGAR
jgi:hypothetical protein